MQLDKMHNIVEEWAATSSDTPTTSSKDSAAHPLIACYRMHFNDGTVDSHGRFWTGAMNDPKIQPPQPEGTLLRLDPDPTLQQMLAPAPSPTGLAGTPPTTLFTPPTR